MFLIVWAMKQIRCVNCHLPCR